MRRWTFPVALDSASPRPIFLQIAHAIAADVARGRLRPGDPLPGSRTLAGTLGVHRNTVLAAYRELAAQGWTTTSTTRGTFVSEAIPGPADRPRRREADPARLGFALEGETGPLPPRRRDPRRIELSTGVPDPRLLPVSMMARAYRRVLVRGGVRLLDYGSAHGTERLRRALASFLATTRGLVDSAERILVTRGSQMAIHLAAQAILAPKGGRVAVEARGYRPAWDALRSAGADLVPFPVDEGGLDVARLARLAARRPFRAVYLTPHHQYPTTVTLDGARRLELLAFAAATRTAILEDDYDNEFHFEGRPVLPLASADEAGVVVYVGSLSKVLAPGLRIGFVSAPTPLVDRMARLRLSIDRQGDLVGEEAIAELLEDGEIGRHVRRMHRVYAARRRTMLDAVAARLGDRLSITPSSGGMALWARVAAGLDADRWAERAGERGVVVLPGRAFTFGGEPSPHLRLGFAALTEAEIRTAIDRLARAAPPRCPRG